MISQNPVLFLHRTNAQCLFMKAQVVPLFSPPAKDPNCKFVNQKQNLNILQNFDIFISNHQTV